MNSILIKKYLNRVVVQFIPAMVLLVLFQGCDTLKAPLQLGFIGTLSGRYSDLGIDVLKGVELAIQEVNETGGIKGRSVELVVKDDGGNPDQAIAAARALSALGIETIIGPNLSFIAVKLVPWCDEHNLLLVSPTVATSKLAGLDDSFIRIIPHNGYHLAKGMAEFVKNTMQLKSGVVFYDETNSAYSRDIVNHTEKAMAESGVAVTTIPFNADKKFDYGAMVKETVTADTGFVYLISSALDSAMFSWQLKKQQARATILISTWALSDEFYRIGNEAVEGAILLTSTIFETDGEKIKEFREKMRGRTPRKAEKFMVYGYEAAQLVLSSLSLDKGRKDLKKSILTIRTFQGLQDKYVIDRFGDVQRPMFPVIIKGGKTVLFKPEFSARESAAK
jgi:branched-chain amino acid transport system substrate-binding protein